MIVVIGQPAYLPVFGPGPAAAAGPPVAVARAAVAAGAFTQLVGKIGVDAAGDALVLDLARSGIGHAALLRDPGRPTPFASGSPDPAAEAETGGVPPGALLEADPEAPTWRGPGTSGDDAGLTLDAEDLDLALRYLGGYGVVVVAEPLSADALAIVAEAAAYAGAQLVVVTQSGSAGPVIDKNVPATLLEAPPDDDEQFAALVGSYAAALDKGATAEEAFRAALGATGWEPMMPPA